MTNWQPLTDLKLWRRNYREGDVGAIVTSIQQFGFNGALRVWQDNTVIAGNHSLKALQALRASGWQPNGAGITSDWQVAVLDVSHLTELEAQGFAVADNRTTALAYNDDLQLSTLLSELASESDALLRATGYSGDDLDAMLAELAGYGDVVDVEPQLDRAAELQEEWGTELGQVWEIPSATVAGKSHRLMCGDSTDADCVAVLMNGERVTGAFTSPPYAVGKEYEVGVSFVDHIAMLEAVAANALAAIDAGGFLFTNFGEIAAQSHAAPMTGSNRQCLYLISKDYWRIFHEDLGMDLYAQRIWYKPFNRLQQPFWTYHTSVPHHQEWEHIWTWRLPGGGTDEVYDWDISSRAVWDTRNEATSDKPLTRHVAAFPISLPGRAIRAHSKAGALLWEPFLGSGTTMVAAEQLGRLCYGMEIAPKYVAVTLQRLADMGLEPRLAS